MISRKVEQPLLSIIIPVYNAKRYLPICLDSILEIDSDEIEIILVDDGSTDGSAEVCDQYQKIQPFIKTIHQKNAGPSSARNRGLMLASGKYIAFFDSDDHISPAALEHTLHSIKKYPEADFWVSDFFRVADNGIVLDKVFQIPDTIEPIQGKGYLRRFLQNRDCVWNVWRYIFDRDFLLKNDMRFIEGVSCAEDLEYIVRVLIKAERPFFLHAPYYFYRVNYGNTLTRRYTKERVQELSKMLQRSMTYLQEHPTDFTPFLIDKIAKEYALNLSMIEEVVPEERPEVQRLFWETRWILGCSHHIGLRSLNKVLLLLGINVFAKFLYWLKCGKRKMRKIKTVLQYGRGRSG